MIKIHVLQHDGHMFLDIQNHADPDVCLAVSTLFQTTVLGLQALQRTFPKQIAVSESCISDDDLAESVTRRKRAARKRRR